MPEKCKEKRKHYFKLYNSEITTQDFSVVIIHSVSESLPPSILLSHPFFFTFYYFSEYKLEI